MTSTKKVDLSGMTINEIKTNYPQGNYKSSMRKTDIIEAALKTVKKPATGVSQGKETEY